MTYFADLSVCTYFRGDAPWLLSVGWLEAGRPHAKGSSTTDDLHALERWVLQTWQPVRACGWHCCSLCGGDEDGPPPMRLINGEHMMLGADNIFVPHGDVMYVAPTLILHYVEIHGYRPPEEFLRALASADPASREYRTACERMWGPT